MATTAVTDPNWMLSTLAQSSAALVAIAAGLLASKLVTHRGEKEHAERDERAILARQEIAELAYGEARAARAHRSRNRCRLAAIQSERKGDPLPDLDEMMGYYETANCEEADIRNWLTEVLEEISAARAALRSVPPLDTSGMDESVVEAVRKRTEQTRQREAEVTQKPFVI